MPDTVDVLDQVKQLVQEIDGLKEDRAAIGEQIRAKQKALHDLVLEGTSTTAS